MTQNLSICIYCPPKFNKLSLVWFATQTFNMKSMSSNLITYFFIMFLLIFLINHCNGPYCLKIYSIFNQKEKKKIYSIWSLYFIIPTIYSHHF